MSEHAWVLEHIASYNAGGLEPDERERLEQHTSTCEACDRALTEARAVDRTLETLFADVRPAPAVEDRLIRSLRAAPRYSLLRIPFYARVGIGAAAVLLLGVMGAGMSSVIQYDGLPFPGAPSAERFRSSLAQNNLKQFGLALRRSDRSPAAEEPMEVFLEGHLEEPKGPRSPEAGSSDKSVQLQDVDQLAANTRSSALMSLGDSRSMSMATNDGATLGRSNYAGVQEWERLSESNRPAGQGNIFVPAPAAGESFKREQAGTGKEGEKKPALAMGETDSDKKDAKAEGRGQGGDAHYTYPYNRPPLSPYLKLIRPGTPFSYYGLPRPASEYDRTVSKLLPKPASDAEKPGANNYFKPTEEAKPAAPFGFANSLTEGGANTLTDTKGSKSAPDASKRSESPSQSRPAEPQKPGEDKKPNQEAPASAAPRKIIIRSGEIEFEIESFDSAVATITKLIGGNTGGFIATVNSEKLPNGKVRGSVVVRIPPDRLDSFVLDLRKELGKGGELKGQRIGSQDITKQYTDLESRLRAARAMEERLLNIIKTGKGEIKDLLQAEKELGVWRTKIEEIEGELRYYGNLVALSTLTITLAEKEIRSPYAVSETERIQMGIEVEDVEKAQQAALAAVAEAKGRVTKSELKQHAAGQFNAILHFEIAPESAGLVRDRFKQIGTLARLEIDRLQQTEGGSGRPQDAKVKRNDAQFQVSLYNLANVAPRETVHINLACVDTEGVYKKILGRVEKATGRVVTSNLNQQRNDQTTGTIAFEVKAAEAEGVLAEIKELGEVMRLQVTENPDTQNVTRSKRGFNVQLWALGQVAPRETATIQLAARDVPAGYRKLQEAIAKAKGRVLNAQLNEQDKRNITAQLDFEVRRTEEAAVAAALAAAGDIYSRSVVRAQDNENVVDSKVLWKVSLINSANIPPRENYVLGIEVENVEKAVVLLTSFAGDLKGRMTEPQINIAKERNGEVNALLVFNVSAGAAPALVEKFKSVGLVRVQKSAVNPQVPDSDMAIARISVTVSNTPLIVASDEGIWPQVRRGLSWSFKALALSLSWLIVGVCVVLPWTLLVYGIFRVVRRTRRQAGSITPAA